MASGELQGVLALEVAKQGRAYYNGVRTHLRRVQRSGVIVAFPILSGLHHHYVRI